MIRTIEIENFRCYRSLSVGPCSRLNLIVGDNGSGKTAFLEAVFLALASGTEVAVRYRAQRGLDGSMGGTTRRIEQGLFGELFHNNDWNRPIKVTLSGDGPEARSLVISRGGSEASLPLEAKDLSQLVATAPVTFTWTDAEKRVRPVSPQIMPNGALRLPDTGEDLPDFLYFSSGISVGSVENASRFSELSKLNKHRRFVDLFIREYDWIKDIDVEVHLGAPAIFATIKGSGRKIPINNVSAGITRMLGIMLAIASAPKSIVLVDEIENGIFHTHLPAMWRMILSLLSEYESQLFVSTHSQECLDALVGTPAKGWQNISVLRAERGESTATLKSIPVRVFVAGVRHGEDVR